MEGKEIVQAYYAGIRVQRDIVVIMEGVISQLDGVIRMHEIQPGVKNGIETGIIKTILTDTLFEARKLSLIS